MSSMQGEPICCDKHNVPSKCAWRGNGPDCNGQCHPGERLIQGGSKGGSPREAGSNVYKCNRGKKVFCCTDIVQESAIKACHWTKWCPPSLPLHLASIPHRLLTC